jgi:acetyl-CoA acetyltransferase
VTGRNPAKDKVAIAGVGLSPYARDRGTTTELGMLLEAAVAAVRDAGLTAADIDGVVGGGLLTGGIDPATVVSALGLPAVTWWARAAPPIVNHLVAAVNAVWTGACEVALVYHSVYRVSGFSRSAGADPFRRRATFGLPDGRAATGDGHTDSEPWSLHGSAGDAASAGRYLAEFGASREDFGRIAINDRSNAAANPNAVLREPLTMAGYLAGRMIREPLCLYDMDVPVDGADAFIVTTAERARDLRVVPVLIHAATMGMTAPPQEHLAAGLETTGQPLAARDLRAKSDLWLEDIDLFYPYDGFTVVALRCFESYGFCGPGEAGAFLADNWDAGQSRIKISGRVPVNTHGGSLSEGGSQGAGHLREAVTQLRGQAGRRQVPGARVALLAPGGFFFNAQGLVLRTD